MFASFVLALRTAGLPASVTQYLTLMGAMKAGVAEYSIDDFYYLPRRRWSRTSASSTSSTAPSPRSSRASRRSPRLHARTSRSNGCEKLARLNSAPRRRRRSRRWAAGTKLMETLKKRFEEQKERHEGGSKMDRHRRHLALRRLRLQPAGHPHRPGQEPQQERGQGLGPARVQGLDDTRRARHAQHQGRAAAPAPVRARGRAPTSSTSTTRSARPPRTPASSTSRWCPSATTR